MLGTDLPKSAPQASSQPSAAWSGHTTQTDPTRPINQSPATCPSLLRDEPALLQLLGSHAESLGAGLSPLEFGSLQLSRSTCSWPEELKAGPVEHRGASAAQLLDPTGPTASHDQQQQEPEAEGRPAWHAVDVDDGGVEAEHGRVPHRSGRRLLAAPGDVAAPACPANVSCSQNASAVFDGLTAAGQVVLQGCTQVGCECWCHARVVIAQSGAPVCP